MPFLLKLELQHYKFYNCMVAPMGDTQKLVCLFCWACRLQNPALQLFGGNDWKDTKAICFWGRSGCEILLFSQLCGGIDGRDTKTVGSFGCAGGEILLFSEHNILICKTCLGHPDVQTILTIR